MLAGKTTFQIIIDQKSIDAFSKRLSEALDHEGAILLNRLCNASVDMLRDMEMSLGRERIAKGWTHTTPKREGDNLVAEVYNQIENETIQNTDASGSPSSKYTIPGATLLKILTYGARPHDIEPRDAKHLAFLSPPGEHKSIFHGTLERPNKGLGAWLYRSESQDEMLFLNHVRHPGVSGDEFLQTTREWIERQLAQDIAKTIQAISTRLL